mgnify:CR=1 FL=1
MSKKETKYVFELSPDAWEFTKDLVETKLKKIAWYLDTQKEKVEKDKEHNPEKYENMVNKREALQKAFDELWKYEEKENE